MRAGWHLAACQAAEQALLDQRLLMVSGSQYQAILDMLDRPEQDNRGWPTCFPGRWSGTLNEAGGATAVGGPSSADKSLNLQG